jgi:heme/copper-type cytochrome/quinol oxidase subunit 3
MSQTAATDPESLAKKFATEVPDPFEHQAHPAENTNTGIPNKKLAMWAFLASDCMFFGTLISTHLIYRKLNPDVVDPTEIFDIHLTSASTFILLISSLFMALAVSAMHKHSIKSARKAMIGVLIFGSIFVGAQVYEFMHFVNHAGLTLSSSVFGSTFYTLTGTHGVHVTIGLIWIAGWLIYSYTGKMTTEHALDVEVAGLYWHFVDIVWIIIFPFVYIAEYLY